MARKPKEAEQEIDLGKQKKRSHAQEWFDIYAVNDREDVKRVCDLTARSCWDQFKIYIPDTIGTEIYAEIFHGTFMSILKFLREKESKYKQYSILIANSINIGYDNNTNEDNEKVGNFMPIMEYVNINRNVVDSYDIPYNDAAELKSKKLVVPKDHTDRQIMLWKVNNVHEAIENYNKIQQDAVQLLLDDYKVDLRNDEAIFPIFCIFMDNVSNVLKMKYRELQGTSVSEVKFNVLSLFDAYYSYDPDDDKEVIEFQPNIAMKLALKNDDAAAAL